jgi:hypothetical protein
MKFQLPSYQTLAEIPVEIRGMWRVVGKICDNLKEAFSNGISLEENIEHSVKKVQMQHGVVATFQHGLKRFPRVVVPIGNRADLVQVLSSDADSVRAVAKLLSVSATCNQLNVLTYEVTVYESAFFSVGDVVLVNGTSNTIAEIKGTSLVFTQPIVGCASITVVLLSETVSFLIF